MKLLDQYVLRSALNKEKKTNKIEACFFSLEIMNNLKKIDLMP